MLLCTPQLFGGVRNPHYQCHAAQDPCMGGREGTCQRKSKGGSQNCAKGEAQGRSSFKGLACAQKTCRGIADVACAFRQGAPYWF